jgi:hypothetical protein
MAVYTPIGGTLPVNRRHGVVFSSMKQQNLVRSMAVPIQPKTPRAAAATQRFSSAASFWSSLSVGERNLWNGGAIAPDTGYSNFLAYQQLRLTWGCAMINAPVPPSPHAYVVPFYGGGVDGTGRNLMLINGPFSPDAYPGTYAAVYWAPNAARLFWQPGSADPGFNTGLPTPIYVFMGVFGPLVVDAINTFDIDDVVTGTLGYRPAPPYDDYSRRMISTTFCSLMTYYFEYALPGVPAVINPTYWHPTPYADGFWFGGPPI